MNKGIVAKASIEVDAAPSVVWDALVNPETIKRYMFGAQVVSDWKEGSSIVWKGEWKGKPYEDKGKILKIQPRRELEYTHFSPLAGAPDLPENYHTVDVQLAEAGGKTRLTLTQDNNPNEEAKGHSEENWKAMLGGLKKVVEGS